MLAISIIALSISGVALIFTIWAARAAATQARAAHDQTEIQREQVETAREQTRLQRDLARQAVQPYVWADIQPDMQQGTVMNLVVGNSGPTVARRVRITFDPGLPSSPAMEEKVAAVERTLSGGLSSLAPGRTIRWALGAALDVMPDDVAQVVAVHVRAQGPAGPVEDLHIDIDVNEWRQSRDAPDGSLHHVRGAIQELTKVVGKLEEGVRRSGER